MPERYFTPDELTRWAREEPARLLAAALIQIDQLKQRSQQLKEARAESQAKQARIEQLEAQLELAKRTSLRQAAPFRLAPEKRSTAPMTPGRKAGHPGSYRRVPERIDEEITVELGACAECGSSQWDEPDVIEQWIEEIPEVRPRVTHLRTYRATCTCCGREATSRHPMQVSEAVGAAGTHLGPRALAMAADLSKAKGLPMRKTCAVLKDCFGLHLTPGGLSQALDRVAAKAQPQYLRLREDLLQSPVVHVDETSWWVGGTFHWLWVFTHPLATVYHIDQRRGRAVLQEILGEVFPGILVSDCLSTYDIETGMQQKCYSHHLKAIRHAKEIHPSQPEQGDGFLHQLSTCLKAALALGKQKAELTAADFETQVSSLEQQIDDLLAKQQNQACEESVRQRLLKQRDHLFTFLRYPGVDATNNLAERQLRPAVIARKISCGNKTASGASTFQILASLAATCSQKDASFIQLISRTLPIFSG